MNSNKSSRVAIALVLATLGLHVQPASAQMANYCQDLVNQRRAYSQAMRSLLNLGHAYNSLGLYDAARGAYEEASVARGFLDAAVTAYRLDCM